MGNCQLETRYDDDEFVIGDVATKVRYTTSVSTGCCVTTYDRHENGLDHFRKDFAWPEMKKFISRKGNSTNHAHPDAAEKRCQATSAIQQICDAIGKRRYDVSTSSRENKWSVAGSRIVYDSADIGQKMRNDKRKSKDVVTMIDVDYYCDIAKYAPATMLIYTHMPENVAGTTVDGHYYCSCEDGIAELNECVKGGARYKSQLWDFSPDLVMVKNWLSFTIYAVEKLPQPDAQGRYLVGLFPKSTVRIPWWLYDTYFKMCCSRIDWGRTPELSRMENVTQIGDYVVMRTLKQTTDTSSLRHKAIADGHSLTLPTRVIAGLLEHVRAHPKDFGTGMVERTLRNAEIPTDCSDCRLLTAYISHCTGINYKIPEQMVNYQCHGAFKLDNLKPVANLVHEPIVGNVSVAPVDSFNNDEACVKGRLTDVANSINPPRDYYRYRDEFVRLLVPIVGKGGPNDEQKVYAEQNRPRQRARNAKQKINIARNDGVKSFQKKELYSGIKDPRNISTVETSQTVHLSCYTTAFKDDVMMKTPWFMPGYDPKTTSDKICDFVRDARKHGKQIIETDYSRFDGTISRFLREIEFMAMERWVSPARQGELRNLLSFETNQKARTRHGVKYNTRYTRLSGSPLTTIGNSIVNAFVAYCVYRKESKGRNAAMLAWKNIGPKYGDDGLDFAGDFTRVCSSLGLTVKIDVRDDWVSFCGRVFVDPVTTTTSITAPSRILPKIPAVVKNEGDAGRNKILGYLVTEGNVPLVGDYLRALTRIHRYTGELDPARIDDHDLVRRIEAGPYPYQEGDKQKVMQFISDDLGVPLDDVHSVIEKLQRANSREDIRGIRVGASAPILDNALGYLV